MTDEDDTVPTDTSGLDITREISDGTPASWRFFKVREFDSHDGVPYPNQWIPLRLARLVETLDAIRARWGSPIHVVSGYRSPAHNAKVGGAKKSQHMEGRAADIRPVPIPGQEFEARVRALHALILQMWNTGHLQELGGLGVYPGWVHVDVRTRVPIGHLAEWTGIGVGSEPSG